MVSTENIIWPGFLAFYPSFRVPRKHIILWLGCHCNASKEATRKKWKELEIFCYLLLNSHKISDLTLHNIQFMLLTYPSSNVDISSVLYEQPHNISVTFAYSYSEWSEFTFLRKKKDKYINCIFFHLMTNLRIYG